MYFLGFELAEWGALIGVLSTLIALFAKGFRVVRAQITAPLIEALNDLRQELEYFKQMIQQEQQQQHQDTTYIKDKIAEHDRLFQRRKEVIA